MSCCALKGVYTITFSAFVKLAHAGGMKYTMLFYTEPMQHPTATTVEPPLVELIDAIGEAPTSLAGRVGAFSPVATKPRKGGGGRVDAADLLLP